MSPASLPAVPPIPRRAARKPRLPSPLRLPLTDPARRLRVRRVAERDLPRIAVPGLFEPPRRRIPPPAPQDRLDATRLVLRIRALALALADLESEARRFRRWQARRSRAAGQKMPAGDDRRKFRRISPLRSGRPPGGRRIPVDDAHYILAEAHALAFLALENPDTS